MVDSCDITRAGDPVTDANGNVTVPTTSVYSGKCKLQTQEGYPSNPDAGEHQWTAATYTVHVPVSGTGGVRVGDTVTVTDSFDPANVDRVFRVESTPRKTFGSAFRLVVEEVTG